MMPTLSLNKYPETIRIGGPEGSQNNRFSKKRKERDHEKETKYEAMDGS